MGIKEIYKSFIIGDIKNTEVEPDVDAWERFLASLPEPKDRFEEAYNKYRCRLEYVPANKTRMLNAAAFAYLTAKKPVIRNTRGRLPALSGTKLLLEKKKDVDYHDVIPPELLADYPDMIAADPLPSGCGELSDEAYALYSELSRRYPTEFYFRLFVLKELSLHSRYIRKYNPSVTAVYVNERNVAGPLLTELYESTGRRLVSFMHGEYLLQMIQAYMDFSEFFVWDGMYIGMFRDDLNCRIGKYTVTVPKKLTKKWHLEDREPEYFCTYYFSGESTASVRKLAEVFKKLEESGRKCLVRPHPRYSHLELISECFDAHMIEDPKKISMEESLGRTRYAVGLHTTVLREAQVEGRGAVIDDISDPPQFRNLKRRKFVVLNGEHKLLSEIISDS